MKVAEKRKAVRGSMSLRAEARWGFGTEAYMNRRTRMNLCFRPLSAPCTVVDCNEKTATMEFSKHRTPHATMATAVQSVLHKYICGCT